MSETLSWLPYNIMSLNTSQKSTGQENIYRVNDLLYGFVFLDQLAWDFIDTPHFQRLRKLKQLPCLEYVYPCATHTRFEHAIGTAHLAKKFITILIKNSPTAYTKKEPSQKHKQGIEREKVIESAVRTVTIAALLRETGHGPLSDSFDSIVGAVKSQGDKYASKWSHERARQTLFFHMRQYIKERKLKTGRGGDKLLEEEVERVKLLMRGEANDERPWEFEIVNNKSNGIDAEKFDKFRRDAFYLGAKNIFVDHELLMNEARIIRNEICYPARHIESVYNIFHCRYKLYKDYYFDVTSKAIEVMVDTVLEILTKQCLEKHFHIKKACEELPCKEQADKPNLFLQLTDSLLDRVEYAFQRVKEGEEKKLLRQAVDILQRIKTRHLCKFVREINYHIKERQDAQVLDWFESQLSPKAVVQSINSRAHINPNELLVTVNDVGFGLQDANPMRKVGFFRKERDGSLNRVQQDKIPRLSMLFTDAYTERSIKVFLKSENAYKFIAVDAAIRHFRENLNDQCKQRFSHDEDHVTNGKGGKTPVRIVKDRNSNVSQSSSLSNIK